MMNECYLYIDKGGILHAVAKEETAKQYSRNGKVIREDIPSAKGYPLVNSDDGMVDITVYGLNEVYINGNVTDGTIVSIDSYLQIKEIYKKLM